MRYLILIGILLVIDLYAFQAFRAVAQSWSSTAKSALTVVFWAIPLLAVALMLTANYTDCPQTNRGFYTILRTVVFIAYISKCLILPILLIDDLRRLILLAVENFGSNEHKVDLSRSRFLSKMGILIAGFPFVTLTYGIIRNPYRYKIFREKIKIDALPKELDGLRIVQISDIHAGSFIFKNLVKNAIDLINAEQPDLVFFTGDLVNDRADEMDDYMDVFDKIQAKYGVFSVLGNHDYGDYAQWNSPEAKQANLDKLKNIHRRLGWRLLLNEHEIVEINGKRLAVIGVENYSALARFPRYGDLAKAHQGTEVAALRLLLSHDPTHWDLQINKFFKDIAVTFSGHTHGFQFGVEIPGFRWSPAQFIYKQWAGLYRQGQQFLYVNRGLGFLGYPGRVGILPEVTVLELKKA